MTETVPPEQQRVQFIDPWARAKHSF